MPPTPTTMSVITCHGFGSPEVLQFDTRPIPTPAVDEMQIKVAAAGVNRADILQRKGKYPPPMGTSDLLGLEVAGTVAALGTDVTDWQIGDRVCALLGGGGYAEYVTVPARHCLPVPESLSLAEAAALPEAVATVYANLFEAGGLRMGETVLLHGGASGIGTTGIQMAKALGATVFTTTRSDEKGIFCNKLGSDFNVNTNLKDFMQAITAHTHGRGVDVILDMAGGDQVGRNLSILATGGRYVCIATQAGTIAEIDLRLVMQKRLILTGSTLRGRDKAEKAGLIGDIRQKIWPWVAAGTVKPVLYRVFSLKNAAEAHKVMESGAHIGKMVLEVS